MLFLIIDGKLEFGFDKVKPWNGLWKRMDFCLEWIEILNFTISLLTEKMILILSIGMNWKTYSFKFGPWTTVFLSVCHKNLPKSKSLTYDFQFGLGLRLRLDKYGVVCKYHASRISHYFRLCFWSFSVPYPFLYT